MIDRPRVLHVYKDYWPPVVGGIEKTINLMAQGTRDEFDVRVLVNNPGSSRTVEETIDGVRVVRVGEWGRLAAAPVSPAFIGRLKTEAAKVELLHFHHPNPTADVAMLMTHPSTPAVMTYHSDVVRQKSAMFAYGRIQKRMMRRMKIIMPTSPNYIESSPWLEPHRDICHVVPLGIDFKWIDRLVAAFEESEREPGAADRLRSEKIELLRMQGLGYTHLDQSLVDRIQRLPHPRIAFVGRLRSYKGLEFLIRALGALPEAVLLIIGSGPISERERLETVAHDARAAERVEFLGSISETEKYWVLRQCDLFCLPSHQRSEAFGICQLEAMACRLPVVSCRLGTGVEYVNEDTVTGYTVEPGSPAALAEGLNRVLAVDPGRRAALGRNGWLRAHKLFSAERMCSELKQVYQRALA